MARSAARLSLPMDDGRQLGPLYFRSDRFAAPLHTHTPPPLTRPPQFIDAWKS